MIFKIKKSLGNYKPGFVLIAVLLVIVVLAVIIIEFNYDSRIKIHLANNFHLSAQALNYADAGIAVVMAALREPQDILGDQTSNPFFSGIVQIPIEESSCVISIEEESGKININSLRNSEGQPIRQRVDQMLRLIDLINNQYPESSPINYSLIPAVLDWVDSDNDITFLPYVKGQNTGAENDYYQKLEHPYRCKNAQFDLLSELLLIKGMTLEIFEGRKVNENTRIKPVSGIKQFLTVYGDGQININEAPIMVIQSLSDSISFTLAQNIVEQRKFSRYSSIEQLKQVPGMTTDIYEEIRESITIKPKDYYYLVTGTGVAEEFERTVQVVFRKDGTTGQVDVLMRCEI